MKIAIVRTPYSMESALIGFQEFFEITNNLKVNQLKQPAILLEFSIIDALAKSLATDERKFDLVLLPPNSRREAMESDYSQLYIWLKKQHLSGSLLASVCVSSFHLAKTGLLDGKRATTHWVYFDAFTKAFPSIELEREQILVDTGEIITVGGLTAWLDLSIYLIRKFFGDELAQWVAKFYLMESGIRKQQCFQIFTPNRDHHDDRILQCQNNLETHFQNVPELLKVASSVGLTVRTFQRRFKQATGETFSIYLQKLRLQKAIELLETSNKSIEEIVWSVGYEDLSSFSTLFQKRTGLSPSKYRKKFRIPN